MVIDRKWFDSSLGDFVGTTDNVNFVIAVNRGNSGPSLTLTTSGQIQTSLPNNNIFIGDVAGSANTDGINNTIIGTQSFGIKSRWIK